MCVKFDPYSCQSLSTFGDDAIHFYLMLKAISQVSDNYVTYSKYIEDNNDKSIAEFLSKSDILGFVYYPEINKTFKSCCDNIDKVRNFLTDRMTKRINNTQDMIGYIEQREESIVPVRTAKTSNSKFDALIMKILENLCIDDLPGMQRFVSGGITKIENKYSVGYLRMSPANKEGYRLVSAKANDVKAPEYKCLVDKDGNILRYYISTKEKDEFSKLFNNLVREFNSGR